MPKNKMCLYCHAYVESACPNQVQARDCATYERTMSRKKAFRNPPESNVTVAEIDAAIETLKKVKQGLTR